MDFKFSGCLVEEKNLTIYAPVIYTAPCIMFWMGAYTLRGEVGGGWALEFPSFLGPVKWERADRLVPVGAQKTSIQFNKLYLGFMTRNIWVRQAA
jgi:hypothetical protein